MAGRRTTPGSQNNPPQLPEMLPPGDFSAAHAAKSGIFNDEASVSLKDPVK